MKGVIALLALVIAVAVGFALWVDRQWEAPGPGEGTVDITIPTGGAARSVARTLAEAKVVESAILFEWLVRYRSLSGSLKAGDYRLARGVSMRRTLETLVKGKTLLIPVTIPEGLTIREMALPLATAGFAGAAEDFVTLATDRATATREGIPASSLEGYLFPETYHFPKNVTGEAILHTMLAEFRRVVRDALPGPIASDPAKLHATVTLASLIEKETAIPDERELVASVYANRLRIGMRLQCDPTVIYALPNFDGDIRKKDLSYDSPYNTYRYAGLPPGPIAAPGRGALMAAVNPAETSYLYFVADGKGGHRFSKSLAEHNKAVRQYLRTSR